MPYCEKCGKENEAGYSFCYNCGAPNPETAGAGGAAGNSNRTDDLPDSFKSARDAVQRSIENGRQYGTKNEFIRNLTADNSAGIKQSRDIKEAIIDPDEQVIAELGNGYAASILTSGKVGKLNATLTDRRIYLKGRFYNGKDGVKKLTRVIQDQILDVQDVTGTWFEYTERYIWLLILAIITFISALITWVGVSVEGIGFIGGFFSAVGISIPGLLFLSAYFKSRHTEFCIQYAGGCIRFRADIVGVANVRDFHRQLRRVKDRHIDMREGRR